MQCAIDNAKRSYDIDLMEEINLIKSGMEIQNNKYPYFWKLIKRDWKDSIKKKIDGQIIKESKIDESLICPMNYLYSLKLSYLKKKEVIPFNDFIIRYDYNDGGNYKIPKKIEGLLEKYSIKLSRYNINYENDTQDDYILLREEFDEMIEELRRTTIGNNQVQLVSILLQRCFIDTKTRNNIQTKKISKNKALLLKALYEMNKELFLKCFIKLA